jgi:translation initiation factor IF-2
VRLNSDDEVEMNKHGAEESPSSEDGAAEETPAVVEAVVGHEQALEAETSETAGRSSHTTPARRDADYKTVLASGTIKNMKSPADEPAEAGAGDAVKKANVSGSSSSAAGKASAGAAGKAGLSGSSADAADTEPAGAGDKADGSGAAAAAGKEATEAKEATGAKEAPSVMAAAAASVVPPSGANSTTGGPQRPGRPSAPVLAAAAIGGLVLLGIPLAFSQGFFGDGHKKATAASGLPGGATMDGYRGFVPSTAAPVPGAAPSHPGRPATSNGAPSQGGPAGSADPASSGGSQPAHSSGKSVAGVGKAQGIFNVVAGPGCSGGSYSRVGYYTKGKSGWLSGSGGFSGQGCNGRFDALPMSGSDTSHDSGLYALWTFDPGSHTQCKVQIYIPNKSDRVYVGGSPAHYSVHQQNGGAILAGFSFDQPGNRGRWVDGRSFTTHGPFWVRVANIGKDWSGNKRTYAHVAAAQVRATCS